MLVIPAIDLKGGQVVRLSQGDPLRQIAYSAARSTYSTRTMMAK
ncbi:MAG TPA: HisA/HisF-related TIM barrel protein [Verrucomicrobiae bacterium]|nr:HisA/HisF-related TIM barrel protein [Verrucomicrobiae bacterium]